MTIKTGIFWFVCGEMIADRYDYIFEAQKHSDFIDYPHSHFDMWDKLSKNRFPYADFATYPRGRLLLDNIFCILIAALRKKRQKGCWASTTLGKRNISFLATNTTVATSVANFNNLPNPCKNRTAPAA